MDRDKFDSLLKWLLLEKFDPSPTYIADKGYLPEPLLIPGYSSFSSYIIFQKTEYVPVETDDSFTKLRNFQKELLSPKNLEILTILESVITSVEYSLVNSKIKNFGSSSFNSFNFNKNKKQASLQILVNPKQSIVEILETLLVPNIGIVDNFEFFVHPNYPDAYLAYWLICKAIKDSNLAGVSIKLFNETCPIPDLIQKKSIVYPPTLAVVMDDADVFSSVDRLIDLLSNLPIVHRKVDIWVQQSVKKKFADKFIVKASKSQAHKSISAIIQADAINPILIASCDPNDVFINLLTFRKVDELLALINRYQLVRELSIWTSNISFSLELIKGIKTSRLFTVNTINDFYLSGHCNYLYFSNTPYQLTTDFESDFSSVVQISSVIDNLKNFDFKRALDISHKATSSIEADLFSTLVSNSSQGKSDFKNLMSLVKANQSTFQCINKCLMLRQLIPIGVVFIHLNEKSKEYGDDWFLTLIASIILNGNCCVIVNSQPETDIPDIELLKSTFGSKLILTSTNVKSIPKGWLYKDSQLVGLSFDAQTLYNLVNPHNLSHIFGTVRSIFFPIADQISLVPSTPSQY